MPMEEARNWRKGEKRADFYAAELRRQQEEKQSRTHLKQVLTPEDLPWEDTPHGRIKHLMHFRMGELIKSLDVYMQELLPGGRSGKHRHMAEECLYVLEGRGYDLHWDPVMSLGETYQWEAQAEPGRYDWEEGDVVYIPPQVIHQHCNAQPDRPARFISATNSVYRHLGFGGIEQLEPAPED